MSRMPKYLKDLIDAFYSLPSVTPKNAQRLAIDFIKLAPQNRKKILEKITDAVLKIKNCIVCGNLSTEDLCEICSDERRDKEVICVVEEIGDVLAIEETDFNGVYHILGGRIDPLNKISPDDLKIEALFERIKNGKVREVILAMNLNKKGLATARYLFNELRQRFPKLKITQPAHGLSEGSEIVYVNPHTLKEAFEERKNFH
ncbi:MAG: recombination protein RecR [Elusimicrobia bacterium]|nr:recombination protein RecR [Elusimicrobiota bacterium]